jgi:hypothetical protein
VLRCVSVTICAVVFVQQLSFQQHNPLVNQQDNPQVNQQATRQLPAPLSSVSESRSGTKESSTLGRQSLLIIYKIREEVSQTRPPPSLCLSLSGKMTPISFIANSSRVSSDSDPPLFLDSILIKWRPVSAVSGIGSWKSSHMILNIPGGVFVSWLVSLSSEVIMGFIVQGQCVSHFFSLRLSFVPSPSASPSCLFPDPISSTSLIYFIQYSIPPLLLLDSPSLSDCSVPEISVSISHNMTLSSETIREYVPGVSDQHLYLLNSGLIR